MSVDGTIMDKLLAHATAADASYTTNRGALLRTSLNDEDFPNVFAFEPQRTINRLGFLQEETSGEYPLLLSTKNETQEEILVRADAIEARIVADPTLTASVDDAWVSRVEIREDPREKIRVALITVSTEKVA